MSAVRYPHVKVWVALATFLIALLDLIWLEPIVRRYRERGAKSQNEFDYSVFGLPRDPLASGKDQAHEDDYRRGSERRRWPLILLHNWT